MSLDLTDRRVYGFATEEHLRFADVDANGHINNGAFLQLLENARVSYMRPGATSAAASPTGAPTG